MATLACTADGNFTTAATWALVDSISYLGAETGVTVVTTSYVASSSFTGDTATIDGIGLKLGNRTGTTGTISVHLAIASVEVAGTLVTINCSDLPAATTAAADGGWIFFKFAGTVLLVGASVYNVEVKTSSASQISLFRDSTAANWSRYLRTTTTQAPVAGDDMIVAGEWTAAATVTARTVTMNETAATDYGSAPTAANSLLTPGIAVCNNGTVTWGTTAATNYYLKVSNSIIIYRVGTWNQGTVATAIPRDSTAILEFDPAADGDYGLIARGGSTIVMQGLSRTSGKNIVSCKLNTDEAIASTSLGVDTDTGWLNNDQIAVASTTRTTTDCEIGALNGNAGASTLTVDGFAGAGGGLAVAHSGTSPTQAEVINITRNVKVRSATSTLMAYFACLDSASVDIDWVEFYYIGATGATKRGLEVNCVSGSVTDFDMQFSSIHDCEIAGFYVTLANTTVTNLIFSNNVLWSLSTITGPSCQIAIAVTPTNWTFDNNILINKGGGSPGWTLNDLGGTFTNNTVVGSGGLGFTFTEAVAFGTFSGNTAHSNSSVGFSIATAGMTGNLLNTTAWRNGSAGVNFASVPTDFILDTVVAFGNTTDNILFSTSVANTRIIGPILNGDTTFSTTNGIRLATANALKTVLIDDGDFSTVSGIKTANTNDINISVVGQTQIVLRNTKLGAATEIATPGNLTDFGFVSSEKHDQTAGNHKTWTRYGATTGGITTDTTFFNIASPSQRLTPIDAVNKLESATLFNGIKVAVANGASVTVGVYIRKSAAGDGAAYTGNQPRLIQKANPALGQSSDVVVATYSSGTGSWNQISGTSSTANDDGAWEFVVDCDGTAGWINVDDWSTS